MPEDADGSTEERLDVPVAFDLLGGQESDDRLADGQPLGGLRRLRHGNFLPLCRAGIDGLQGFSRGSGE